jgi:hypothetical protein
MANLSSFVCRFNVVLALSATVAFHVRADQVVMQNGDRYNGRVLSVTATNVVLQSDVLGVVNLSRSRVVNLTMGLTAMTNSAPIVHLAKTNVATDLSATLRQLGMQTNLAQQVRAQFLTTANPEANQKFDQMLNDLGTGKMSINDLRAQAKSAAAQLRELERDAGDEGSGTMGVYLSILDSFLAETESASSSPTTNAATQKKP